MRKVKFLTADNIGLLHKVGSWVIKKSEGTKFDHVAILITDYGIEWVYEAVFPNARKIRLDEWKKTFKIIDQYELDLDDLGYLKFISELNSQVGKPYSLIQLILIWTSNVLGLFESVIRKTIWNGNKALICTELVARPIHYALDYNFNKSFDVIDLNDIKKALYDLGASRCL